jgi:hypothetical protein
MAAEHLLDGRHTRLVAVAQAGLALSMLVLFAGLDFFFPTAYRLQAGVHGISAIGALIVGTLLTHRVYRVLRGARFDLRQLRNWAFGATLLNFLGAVSGNWIYMRYRGQDGPRDWILAQVPTFHNVMMEFKEFVSLFPFPLMLAASFILVYYGDGIRWRRDLAQFVGVLILAAWGFLMFGFVTGLTLAKLHFV